MKTPWAPSRLKRVSFRFFHVKKRVFQNRRCLVVVGGKSVCRPKNRCFFFVRLRFGHRLHRCASQSIFAEWCCLTCCQTLDCCIRGGVTWWNLLVPLDGFGNKKENPLVFGNTAEFEGGNWELEEWWDFFGRRLQFRAWFSGFHFKFGKVDVCVSDVDSGGSPFVLNRRLSGQLAVYNFEGGPCLRCAAWLQGRWSKQNSMATRLVLLAPSEVRPSFLWCQLHQLNSFSNFWTKKKMEWFGALWTLLQWAGTQNPPMGIRSFQFSHRQQMPNLWPPVKSMVCLGPLWALWVHWPPWKPSRCVKLTVVVLKISGVKRFKMKDDQEVLDIFLVHLVFSFFLVTFGWSHDHDLDARCLSKTLHCINHACGASCFCLILPAVCTLVAPCESKGRNFSFPFVDS